MIYKKSLFLILTPFILQAYANETINITNTGGTQMGSSSESLTIVKKKNKSYCQSHIQEKFQVQTGFSINRQTEIELVNGDIAFEDLRGLSFYNPLGLYPMRVTYITNEFGDFFKKDKEEIEDYSFDQSEFKNLILYKDKIVFQVDSLEKLERNRVSELNRFTLWGISEDCMKQFKSFLNKRNISYTLRREEKGIKLKK